MARETSRTLNESRAGERVTPTSQAIAERAVRVEALLVLDEEWGLGRLRGPALDPELSEQHRG